MRFAESKNLLDWSLLPKECVYTKERYSAKAASCGFLMAGST